MLDDYSSTGTNNLMPCSGPVNDLGDWVILPLAISSDVARFGGLPQPGACVHLALDQLSKPSDLSGNPEFVDVSFDVVIDAPGQTPGGTRLANGDTGFPETAEVQLGVTGGQFTGTGGALASSVDETVAAGTPFLARVDRGATPDPDVEVHLNGDVIGLDFAAAAEATSPALFSSDLPFDVTIGQPGAASIAFDPTTATSTVLAPGGSTQLCAQITDGNGGHPHGQTIGFTLNGPGALTTQSVSSDGSGRGCTTYQHPAGIVADGDTATVTADAGTGADNVTDSVTLTPQWAGIELAVTPSSTGTPVAATNTAVPVAPGDTVDLGAVLTGAGATVNDPPEPIAADQVRVQVDSGPGTLTTPLGATGTDLALTTDADGGVAVHWDGGGASGDVTLRVSYPLNGPGVAATVTLARTTRTFTGHVSQVVSSVQHPEFGTTTSSTTISFDVSMDVLPDGTLTSATATGSYSESSSEPGATTAECPPTDVITRSSNASGTAVSTEAEGQAVPGGFVGIYVEVQGTLSITDFNGFCVAATTTQALDQFVSIGAQPVFDSHGTLVAIDFTDNSTYDNGVYVVTTTASGTLT